MPFLFDSELGNGFSIKYAQNSVLYLYNTWIEPKLKTNTAFHVGLAKKVRPMFSAVEQEHDKHCHLGVKCYHPFYTSSHGSVRNGFLLLGSLSIKKNFIAIEIPVDLVIIRFLLTKIYLTTVKDQQLANGNKFNVRRLSTRTMWQWGNGLHGS